jgi:hypothetical protein
MDESPQVGDSNGMHLDGSRGRDDGLQLTYAAPFTFSSASSSSGASEDSIAPDLLEAHRQVQDAISRLNRMSTWIRRLGARYRNAKAENFQDIDENNNNLTLKFERWAALKVKLSIPRAKEELRHRMAMAIARRRNRIAYMKKHQQKLAQRAPEIKPEVPKTNELRVVSEGQSPLLPTLKVADQDRSSRQSRVPMSTTSPSGAGSAPHIQIPRIKLRASRQVQCQVLSQVCNLTENGRTFHPGLLKVTRMCSYVLLLHTMPKSRTSS